MKLVGSKGAVRSAEFHKKKEREKKFYQFFFIVVFLFVLVGPIFLFRSSKLLITEVSISGNVVTQVAEIESLVRERLSGYYLGLIPKSSAVFYPKDSIANILDERIPRLTSVNISLNGLRGVNVEVVEREPFALYCAEMVDKELCYFLDNSGYIYSEAPDFTNGVYLIYRREPSLESPVDKYFLDKNEFAKVNKFINSLSKLEIEPVGILYKDSEYFLTQASGPKIIWNSNQDSDKVLIDLESFLKGSKLKAEEIGNMSYLDLRFDNKIYYKARE